MDIVIEKLEGAAYLLEKLFPDIGVKLENAHMGEDSIDYLSRTLFYSLFSFFVVFSCFTYISRETQTGLGWGLFLSFMCFFFMFYYQINKPSLLVKKRLSNIERNLSYAIQSLYIQVSSGVPVYDAMKMISIGGYGAVSDEFAHAMQEMESGKPIIEALESLVARNPSPYFQKVIWQIINSLTGGGDLKKNLNTILNTISRDQGNLIREYGADLGLLSMTYMMAAVVLPSLGITVLITVSSLPEMGSKVNESLFWIILGIALILQVQFAMIIKIKRPKLIGG